jgi:O-antigen ligase
MALVCDVISSFWSYSRGAFAVMPFGYGITLLVCLLDRRHAMRTFRRLLPIALVALLGVFAILPRIVQRFATAPKASGDTRVELAYCAWEMIKDEPLRGVGINNWSLKMDAEHPYQDNASKIVGRELDYTGIVETVYLLVGAECGIPALVAMLVWFGWYWVSCVKLLRRLMRTRWYFVPAGILGGLTANYMQSVLEWVLRQQMNIICLLFMFAIISYLNTDWRRLLELERKQE